MPADEFDRKAASRSTMRAASGSHQMLYSAAGVTLPSQQGAPPMTTQRLTFAAMSGCFFQGQRDVGQRPERDQDEAGVRVDGPDDGVDGRFSVPRLRRGRRVAVIAKAVVAVEPLRVRDAGVSAVFPRRKKRERSIRKVPRYRGRFGWPAATGTLPATVVIAMTSICGLRSAMISATASSEAVSVSIRKGRFTRRRIANQLGNKYQNRGSLRTALSGDVGPRLAGNER